MAIDNVRLPTDVERGARGGPRFKTSIQTALSGVEQRVAEWDHARCEFDISYGIRTKADLLSVIKQYRARQGPAYPFRFKDWSDFEGTTEDLGDGDGTTTQFQIVKHYTDGVISVSRTIYLPVSGTLTVYVNGVAQTETTHYSVNYSTGLITFVSAPVASPTQTITATFEFDVAVRFAEDELNVSVRLTDDEGDYLLGEIPSINLIEVLSEA